MTTILNTGKTADIGKTWLRFYLSMRSRGLTVMVVVSQSRDVRSSPAVDKNFSFCKFCARSLQLEEAHENEISHDKHLAETLF